jgi:hypothetical protein
MIWFRWQHRIRKGLFVLNDFTNDNWDDERLDKIKRLSKKRYLRKLKKEKKFWNSFSVTAFIAVIVFIGLIGLMIFLRPKTSDIEKRTLTEFPKVTAAGIMDGSFFTDLETWYADTFPMRETLIRAEAKIENLFGIRGTAIYRNTSSEETADRIPDASESVEEASSAGALSASASSSLSGTAATPSATPSPKAASSATPTASPAPADPDADETAGGGEINDAPEVAGDIYVAGNSGFEIWYFRQDGFDQYASMVNTVKANLGDSVGVFTVPIPLSSGVILSDSAQAAVKSSNQKDAISYLGTRLQGNVHLVNIYGILRHHDKEYIYFRTDHHWTQLGAYYAYRKFCKEKGFTPHSLNEYQKLEFPGFLGTFYSSSNQSPALASNPDTVQAFVPLSTNTETMTTKTGQTCQWNIITDASGYGTGTKYSCFIGGDQPYVEIDNPNINDDSACIVVKESFGNAFAPFLTDHYDKTYVIDYRYFKGNLTQLAKSHASCDVIFANNVSAINSTKRSQEMLALFPAG